MNSKSLKYIDDMLKSNKLSIASEKKQILRAEQFLLYLEKYLAEQNIIKDSISNGVMIKEELTNVVSKVNETNNESGMKIKTPSPAKENNNKMDVSDTESDNETAIMISDSDESPEPISDGLLQPLNILYIKNTTIHQIDLRNGCIICGSNGLLIKYLKEKTIVYNTGTRDDILYVESMHHRFSIFLICFTKLKVIVFKINDKTPFRVIDLLKPFHQRIGNVYQNKNTVIIGNIDGSINSLCLSSWEIYKIQVPRCPKLRRLFQISCKGKLRLVEMEDKQVYKTKNTNFTGLQSIEGVVNVKGIFRHGANQYILYSNDKIWFLDEECCVVECLIFKYRVKLINLNQQYLVVVDRKNTVRVYSIMISDDSFVSELFEWKIETNITAVAVDDCKVYLAMDNDVSTVHLTPQ